MSQNIYNFTINQGETFSKSVTWKDAAGVVVNLTGYTARMQLRRKVNSETIEKSLTTENGGILITAPLTGVITMFMSATDTAFLSGVYVYDLELVSAGIVKRLLQGTITLDLEVTR